MADRSRGDNRFPLRIHVTGQWTKFIKGRDYYFGTDKEAALVKYVRLLADLKAGRVPLPLRDGETTLADLCNAFLAAKRLRVDSGELTPGTWSQYRGACVRVLEAFGRDRAAADLAPDDFGRLRASAADTLGPRALGQFTILVRSMFGWGYETGRLKVPALFGPDFSPPPKRLVRLARSERGPMLISAENLRAMLALADPQLKAMLLLGINCGYGPSDCSRLNRDDLQTEPGWLSGLRKKTGTPRRCPLWPETVAALEATESVRPAARDYLDAYAAFLTRAGRRWVRHVDRGNMPATRRDSLGTAFDRLAKRCGVKLPGRFYVLRHTFRTVADETKDQVAVRLIMGHTDPGIDDHYRERVGDERLRAVAEHVWAWLSRG